MQQGRRRWNGPTESAHRVTLCPDPNRSEGTRTPSGAPISSPKRTNRAPISTESRTAPTQDQPPERPPNRPRRPLIRSPLPRRSKNRGEKNPRHVTIVSMACHYCLACHYCHGMRHVWHVAIACGIYAHMSETARNASCHLCAEPRRHKNKQHAEQVTSVAFNNP